MTAATGDEFISLSTTDRDTVNDPGGRLLEHGGLAAAIQAQSMRHPRSGSRDGLGDRELTQNSEDYSWGLSFASSNGAKMDLFGNFFGSSLGISTGSDSSTQLGRSTETWIMGDDIDAPPTG